MQQSVPFIATNKTFTGKKVALYCEGHPVKLTGQIDQAASTFPIAAGTVLGKITSSGKLAPYDNTKDTGVEVAVGILEDQIDDTGYDQVVSYIVHGFVYEASCVGLDSGAKTDLAGKIYFI